MIAPARLLVLALLLPAAAARGADPARPSPAVAYRSSIAAVLASRGALQLSDGEVRELEQAESQLRREQEAARNEAAHPEDAPASAPAARPSGGPPSGSPGGMGGKVRPPPPSRNAGPSAADLLQQRLDALDTEALLRAVESLPEAKREKAVEVASRYREQLYEQRERDRGR